MASKERGNKPRGRPAAAETADVRGAILDTAEALFAQNGFASVSVRDIAGRVGVTPAMVHYYFGSKKALLQQMFV